MRTPFALVLAAGLVACSKPASEAPTNTPTPAAEPATPAGPPASVDAPPEGALRFQGGHGNLIHFKGSKLTMSHEGGFESFRGWVHAPGDDLAAGKVVVEIDMPSVFTDSGGLSRHIKTDDFFAVERFPTARFESSRVEAKAEGEHTHVVHGTLTLKGVSKAISFPASIRKEGEGVKVVADLVLDRQAYGIAYPGAPDDLIADAVPVHLEVLAAG